MTQATTGNQHNTTQKKGERMHTNAAQVEQVNGYWLASKERADGVTLYGIVRKDKADAEQDAQKLEREGIMFESIEDIKELNQRTGRHFFSDDTMSFFKSRILDGVINGRFFITSERPWGSDNRWYFVREALADGTINTHRNEDTEHGGFKTAAIARRVAREGGVE